LKTLFFTATVVKFEYFSSLNEFQIRSYSAVLYMKSEDKNMQLEDIGKMIYLLLSVLRILCA